MQGRKEETIGQKRIKFIMSLLVALLCVIMLGLISCKKETLDKSTVVISCFNEDMLSSKVKCETEIRPVCGCNGTTYANPCEAQYVYGVKSWTVGACEIDTACLKPVIFSDSNIAPCDSTYAPVCGCNGVTYKNECFAERGGVRSYALGVCESAIFSACKGSLIKVGREVDQAEIYLWEKNIHLSCLTCPTPQYAVTDSIPDTLNLKVYLNFDLFKKEIPSGIFQYVVKGKLCPN